ncbi:MAG: GGDEF domain-containing protein [Lachnospiraceae bacterium]|nr:GGDEF domain-containing protein [Lachnospiraceae bacterium]
MGRLFHALRQILYGTRKFDDKIKYQCIAGMIAFVHLTFVFVFASFNIMPLLIYNIFVVLFYGTMIVILNNKNMYTFVFLSSFIEIMFHSTMATIVLGFDWGFMLYTVSLVPTAFYMGFTLPKIKRALTVSSTVTVVVWLCYFLGLAYSKNFGHHIEVDNQHYVNIMFYYNSFLAFAFIWIVSMLFSIEVKYMRVTLERENLSLEQDAVIDPLTKLHNRRGMDGILKSAVGLAEKGDQTFSMIMADIDDFKRINDNYGHNQGDVVLQEVAKVILNNVRENDAVCRWGGEEMLVLLPVDSETASKVAERIRKDVESLAIVSDGNHMKVTLTMGVCEYEEGMNLRGFVEKADQRLYYGKNHGKNKVISDVINFD